MGGWVFVHEKQRSKTSGNDKRLHHIFYEEHKIFIIAIMIVISINLTYSPFIDLGNAYSNLTTRCMRHDSSG